MRRRAAWIAPALLLVTAGVAPAASRAVHLRTSDGVSIAAAVYDAPSTPAPAVVLVPMFTRTQEDWRPFAERLQAAGVTAVAIDLRGHGQSEGVSTPSPAMSLDVQAVLTWLGERPEVRSGAIAIVGASLGASVAILAAAEVPAVRGVALLSPASDYRGVRLDGAARKYGARPMFIAASSEDPYAVRTLRALAGVDQPQREQRVSAVVAHGSQLLERDGELAAALVDWLRRTLLS